MSEKRNLSRHRKRFTVRFGSEDCSRTGFTEDISTTGLFIKTAYVSNPGSLLKVELAIDDNRKVLLDARVMWAKRVPPQMIHIVKKSGMGIRIVRFTSGEAEFKELCEELSLPFAELL